MCLRPPFFSLSFSKKKNDHLPLIFSRASDCPLSLSIPYADKLCTGPQPQPSFFDKVHPPHPHKISRPPLARNPEPRTQDPLCQHLFHTNNLSDSKPYKLVSHNKIIFFGARKGNLHPYPYHVHFRHNEMQSHIHDHDPIIRGPNLDVDEKNLCGSNRPERGCGGAGVCGLSRLSRSQGDSKESPATNPSLST